MKTIGETILSTIPAISSHNGLPHSNSRDFFNPWTCIRQSLYLVFNSCSSSCVSNSFSWISYALIGTGEYLRKLKLNFPVFLSSVECVISALKDRQNPSLLRRSSSLPASTGLSSPVIFMIPYSLHKNINRIIIHAPICSRR